MDGELNCFAQHGRNPQRPGPRVNFVRSGRACKVGNPVDLYISSGRCGRFSVIYGRFHSLLVRISTFISRGFSGVGSLFFLLLGIVCLRNLAGRCTLFVGMEIANCSHDGGKGRVAFAFLIEMTVI